jgi:hypothetical protein
MTDNIHPVVELLAARMESNPEEFGADEIGRWDVWMTQMEGLLTEEEKLLLRVPMMQSIHEEVLDELLNGPDKRRKEAEERELILKSALAQQQAVQQKLAAQQQQLQGYQQAYGGGGAGIVGKSYTNAIMDSYDYDLDRYRNTPTGHLPVANGGTDSTTGTLTNTINQLKQHLGAKK